MTGQIHDKLIYQNSEYQIVSVLGEGLFEPHQFDLKPVETFTACWRGYLCRYVVQAGSLMLDRLEINLAKLQGGKYHDIKGPAIHGIKPLTQGSESLFNNLYKDLSLKIAFSGDLLIGDDFIDEHYEHMGFQSPWKFRVVLKLTFEKGNLRGRQDISEHMKKVRQSVVNYSQELFSSDENKLDQ